MENTAQQSQTIREFAELDLAYGQKQESKRIGGAELINALELQELLDALPFDPRKLYCIKTGQPRGERAWSQFYDLIALHEKDQAKLILSLMQEEGCSVAWAQTDGATLERLRVIDPIGYFVYAASFLTMHNYKAPLVSRQDEATARANLFQIKIRTYEKLFAAIHTDDLTNNMANLHVANRHLQNILAYNPALLNLPFENPLDVLKAFSDGLLYAKLSRAFKSWLQRETEFFDPTKIWDTLNQSKGAGQFRTKKKTNKQKRVDDMIDELGNMGVDLTVFRDHTHWTKEFFAKEQARKQRGEETINLPTKSKYSAENPKPGSFLAKFGKKGSTE